MSRENKSFIWRRTKQDIVTGLLLKNLDHIIQNILLRLDLTSLRSSAMVCRRWHKYIHGMRRMKDESTVRLPKQVSEIDHVTFLEDGTVALCGNRDGSVNLYLLATGECQSVRLRWDRDG